ncbi:MAG: 30S ribosomal protein S19e [DPANN group archaeon]|nr:30S ribosomal protein S19e [DPANN group archaeon]
MVSVFKVSPQSLVKETAEELKGKFQAPSWATFVKTGHNKERPPMQPDWWHIRAASVLRVIYKDGPVGVSKLRSKYGSRKNRGVKPHKFTRASGNIIRKILQQLETAGLVQQQKTGVHKGRIITPAGSSLLSKIAKKVEK